MNNAKEVLLPATPSILASKAQWASGGKVYNNNLFNYPMGSNQSSEVRLPIIAKEHWHEIPLPPSIRRRAIHGQYKLFKNVLTNERIEQYSLTLQGDHYEQYLQSFAYRQQQEAIVATRYFESAKEDAFCSSRVLAKVYLEHTPYRLSAIHDIPLPESLYVLGAALAGFQKLQALTGSFRPCEDMVGIDCEGRIKVWLSANFSASLLAAPLYLEGTDRQCETSMVMELVSLVDRNTAYQQQQAPRLMAYFQENSETVTFSVAQQLVEEYSKKYRLPIPKYFLSILRLLPSSRLSEEDCESHSETNDPFPTAQERPHIVHYISPSLISNTHIPSQLASKEEFRSLTCIEQQLLDPKEVESTANNNQCSIASHRDSRHGLPRVNFNYSSRVDLAHSSNPLQLPLSRIAEGSSGELTRRVTYSGMNEDYELDEQLAKDMVRFFSS